MGIAPTIMPMTTPATTDRNTSGENRCCAAINAASNMPSNTANTSLLLPPCSSGTPAASPVDPAGLSSAGGTCSDDNLLCRLRARASFCHIHALHQVIQLSFVVLRLDQLVERRIKLLRSTVAALESPLFHRSDERGI